MPAPKSRRPANLGCETVSPGFLLLVAAHEQVQAAMDHVEQQPLVGANPFDTKALVEVQVQLDRAQRGLLAPVVGALGQQVQFEAVARLQVDHQPVGHTLRRIEDRVRRRPEVDHDVSVARRQPFAGAQVEGHAGPAPVGDLGAQRHEGFDRAVRVHAGLLAIGRHRLAGYRAFRVLAAYHVL